VQTGVYREGRHKPEQVQVRAKHDTNQLQVGGCIFDPRFYLSNYFHADFSDILYECEFAEMFFVTASAVSFRDIPDTGNSIAMTVQFFFASENIVCYGSH
jgi:hypothetical protein